MKIYVKNMACESCKIFVKEALEEVKLYKQGKIKLQSFDDFINEQGFLIKVARSS